MRCRCQIYTCFHYVNARNAGLEKTTHEKRLHSITYQTRAQLSSAVWNMACASYTFTWQMVYEIEFASVIRGHHVYKTEWSPKLGERLICQNDEWKEAKEHDECAVGTFIQEGSKLVGHLPIKLSFLVFTFLQAHADNQVVVEVTGSRKLENGLVIPGTFKAVKRSQWLGAKFYEELNKVKQLCAHMDISIK